MALRNKVQLITYPDSLGGNLVSFSHLLNRYLPDAFGGIHILPLYPSTGDRGFAPVDYREVDPKFGDWKDVKRLSKDYDILLDFMVNHISRHSDPFKDFTKKGRQSAFADMFLTLDKVWPGGVPVQADLAKIFLRRPVHCFADITVESTGETERVWATFGTRDWSEQIDLDVNSPVTRKWFEETFSFLHSQGVNTLRLDAVAFVIKKAGTACFFVEPEIYAFLDWINALAADTGLNLLLEVHAPLSLQVALGQRGFWVYNFYLPALVLDALINRDATALAQHLAVCPHRQVTMLDCHDGIPVMPDMQGLLPIDRLEQIVRYCEAHGANISRIYAEPGATELDAHQINCTYYSALGSNDDAYITARAIQFFAPGIPQVYYVGLLAGENDLQALVDNPDGRAVNRHNFTIPEFMEGLYKPVTKRLLKLIQFRNEHPAFDGDFSVDEGDADHFALRWQKGAAQCRLQVDFERGKSEIQYSNGDDQLMTYIP